MAFVLRARLLNCCRQSSPSSLQICARSLTSITQKGTNYESPAFKDPIRQVFISQSSDVFTNLALEDWLYRNHDFDHKHLLLLWRNKPCVVIGRHQNPWTEANVPFLRSSSISLARRHSGGGTVYHDLGNINCTFFTRKSAYHRKRNLEIICSAIKRLTALNVSVNKREDIVLNEEHKISGTAAKLGKDTAYHHCTVLVDVNECLLHDALNSHATSIETRATQSVRVPVRNLRQVDPTLDIDALQESIGWEFLRTSVEGVDGGMEVANHQRGFQMIRPDDNWFPGLAKLREDLQSHQWIFGKTPKFKVKKSFPVPLELFANIASDKEHEVKIEFDVYFGVIQDVRVQLPVDHFNDPDLDLSGVMHGLVFGESVPRAVQEALETQKMSKEKRKFICECVEAMVGKYT